MKLDIQTYKRAGLSPSDTARIFSVSRITASKWFNGGNVHPLVTCRVSATTKVVQLAIERGLLPVGIPVYRSDERTEAIRAALTTAERADK